jgi:hypothetical protein
MERTMSLPKVTQALLHNVLIKSFNNLSDNTHALHLDGYIILIPIQPVFVIIPQERKFI